MRNKPYQVLSIHTLQVSSAHCFIASHLKLGCWTLIFCVSAADLELSEGWIHACPISEHKVCKKFWYPHFFAEKLHSVCGLVVQYIAAVPAWRFKCFNDTDKTRIPAGRDCWISGKLLRILLCIYDSACWEGGSMAPWDPLWICHCV